MWKLRFHTENKCINGEKKEKSPYSYTQAGGAYLNNVLPSRVETTTSNKSITVYDLTEDCLGY